MRYVLQLAIQTLDLKGYLKVYGFQDDTLIDLVVTHDCKHFLSKHCTEAIEIQLYGDMKVRQGGVGDR